MLEKQFFIYDKDRVLQIQAWKINLAEVFKKKGWIPYTNNPLSPNFGFFLVFMLILG